MKKLIIVLLFLLIIPLAFSAKVTQTFAGTVGLDLRIPPAEFIKQNTDVQANMHVFNLSDGLVLDNTTAECHLHLFNSSGHHMIEKEMNFNGVNNDFFLNINKENLSQLGFISFIIQCNTSSEGGFVSGSLRVTKDGKEEIKADITAIMIGLVLFAILFLIIGGAMLMRREEK